MGRRDLARGEARARASARDAAGVGASGVVELMTHTRTYRKWTILVEIEDFDGRHRARVYVREPGRRRNEQVPLGLGVTKAVADVDDAKEAGFTKRQRWIDDQLPKPRRRA